MVEVEALRVREVGDAELLRVRRLVLQGLPSDGRAAGLGELVPPVS